MSRLSVTMKRRTSSMKSLTMVLAVCLIASTWLPPGDAQEKKPGATASSSRLRTRVTDDTSCEGTYRFSENPGRDARAGPMSSENTIAIYKSRNNLIADMDADG